MNIFCIIIIIIIIIIQNPSSSCGFRVKNVASVLVLALELREKPSELISCL